MKKIVIIILLSQICADSIAQWNTYYGTGGGGSSGQYNSGFGNGAGNGLTGSQNTLIGTSAGGGGFLSGNDNNFFGLNAGYNTTSGYSNIAIGRDAGFNLSSGNSNVFIGNGSGETNSYGTKNTFIGRNSGHSNLGSYNVFIGYNSGYYEIGSDKLYIDNSNTITPLIYGDFSTDLLRLNGKLEIKAPNTGNNLFTISATQGNADIRFDANGVIKGYVWYSALYDAMAFGNGSPSNSIFVNSSGNVGIGTTDPFNVHDWNKVLDVRGLAHGKIIATTTNGGVRNGIYSDNTQYGGSGLVGTESNHNLHLIANYSPRVSILTNGNVGIGTTMPRGIFDVDRPGDIYLVDDPNTGGTGQSIFIPGHIYISPYVTGSDWSYIQARRPNTTGTTHLRLRTTNSGSLTEAMSILGNGHVGISTTNPSYLLQVSNAYCDGNTWYNISDKNLKENFARIRQEESILTKVMELPIHYWNYKGDNTNRHIGPTAQDFYKTFNLGNNDKAISTVDESGIALAAIQELNRETQQLKKLFQDQQLLLEQQQLLIASLLQSKSEISDNITGDESGLKLYQNQPNPFQRDTKIIMEIPQEINYAILYICDLHGKTVQQQIITERGLTSTIIEGGKLSSGVYFYMLIGDGSATGAKRMVLTE